MSNFTVMAITMTTRDYPHLLLITNFGFWVLNESAILEWCDEHTPRYLHEGMLLSFLREADRTLFLLKWA